MKAELLQELNKPALVHLCAQSRTLYLHKQFFTSSTNHEHDLCRALNVLLCSAAFSPFTQVECSHLSCFSGTLPHNHSLVEWSAPCIQFWIILFQHVLLLHALKLFCKVLPIPTVEYSPLCSRTLPPIHTVHECSPLLHRSRIFSPLFQSTTSHSHCSTMFSPFTQIQNVLSIDSSRTFFPLHCSTKFSMFVLFWNVHSSRMFSPSCSNIVLECFAH